MGMQRFLEGRMSFVRDLLRSDVDVTYGDIVLVTCAVLSACAAHRWPRAGRDSDKKKFTRLLIEHSAPEFRTSWISIPSLLNDGLIGEGETPWGTPGSECRIFCDDEIDLALQEAVARFPQITPQKIREYSYASLIYKLLRCAYSHEYRPHVSINEVEASRREARISYIGRISANGTERRVSFHLEYLIRLAEYHVSILP
ncbi:hypothetical protein [Anaerobaca lacustris]|uniref:Uncharacterized protein n=1 Tax=Anaerobaca lacustris TaxID=3044600 RepID=A0AAW6TV32_9BACT|nr:hypothetical protein [Sedimentisphaerales bacterium M17dextr]